ncbi:Hypothetical protein NGAL_HAMBI1145_02550 [Neorhizobium galegae bv. officinalis]|uniref:DUF3885 domain-containing protein n=1 Tax=Neorhizobium galegae bv. officinalis TaxID=323656 RepID=A0A0T7F9D6_NEOGA|nr:hypothetical protein [Neorhizobium galegae]CDZ31493.1 Hypothetical protein NGAL_HAMBI1145_02550 [Neorhizobium galegae bv. officinalis]
MASFDAAWQHFYPVVPPLSFIMREAALPWVRFHYLPGSKRYAESHVEYEGVLQRLSTLAKMIFDPGEDCWIVRCESPFAGGSKQRAGAKSRFMELHPCKSSTRIGEVRLEDGEEIWSAYAAKCSWDFIGSRQLLIAIADDMTDGKDWTLWFSARSGRVYAPYDGGIDIFSNSIDWIGSLRDSFPDWLSNDASGL